MKLSISRALAALAFAFLSTSANAAEYLVKYKNQAGMKQVQAQVLSANMGMALLDQHDKGSYLLVDIAKKAEALQLARLLSNPNVEWVVPNYKLYAFGDFSKANVNTTALREQWALTKVQAEKAWARATNKGRKNIIIGVIDTGVDYKHPNLAPNMVPGYDFRDNDSDPMDLTSDKNPGHGTHCAGIAAATGTVENGIAGMGPEVSIMPIRFLGADGSGDLNQGIKSIDYAIEKGVQVISASWGATVQRSLAKPLIEAVERADAKGVIFVAAAANDGRNNDQTEVFPANANTPNMIAVAASDSNDAKPSWSNYGKAMVHLSSPGLKIMSTLPNNQYGELSGTSMATPLVSGLVAFLKAQDPSLTGAQIRALLQTTGAKVSIETACNCRVDAFAAVDTLLNKKIWLVPTAATIAENGSTQISAMNAQGAVTYTSSNPSVITVDGSGTVKAVSKGSAQITAKDSAGNSVTSLDFNVGATASENPGSCPFGDQAMCDLICQIMPEMPFCNMAK